MIKPKINRLFLVDSVSESSSWNIGVSTYKDEMTADICSTLDEGLIGRVEVPDITSLHDQDDDPVNARDDDIEGERGAHVVVLTPD